MLPVGREVAVAGELGHQATSGDYVEDEVRHGSAAELCTVRGSLDDCRAKDLATTDIEVASPGDRVSD